MSKGSLRCFWFAEIENPLLVRGGHSVALDTDKEGNPGHTRINVWTEMFLVICMRYRSLPDPRTLTLDEIEFFYEGIRAQLEEDTKPLPAKPR